MDYLCGWFTIDFLSSLPVQLIINLASDTSDAGDKTEQSGGALFRALKLIKLIKLTGTV